MLNKIKAPLVLMLICLISSGLLVAAYNLTYVDNTGVVTEKLRNGCDEVIANDNVAGGGHYEMLTDVAYDGVTSFIVDSKLGMCAIELIVSGYQKDGLHLLVGFDNSGAVSGVNIIAIQETPGLGTKVKDKSFLDKFLGLTDPNVKVDAITGATYSSNAVNRAVSLAIEAYNARKGEIFR